VTDIKFELDDSRQIFLDALFESKTYEGLLEGRPSLSVNYEVLNSQAETVQRIWPEATYVTLGLDFYKGRLNEALPPICCIGKFVSYKPVPNQEKMASSLVVIWFQNEMFPLIEGANKKWLKEIVWNKVARSFDW
jgi:hypothetical protein